MEQPNSDTIDFNVRYDCIGYERVNDFHWWSLYADSDDIYFGAPLCWYSFQEYNPAEADKFWECGISSLQKFVKEFPKFKKKVVRCITKLDEL